MFSITYILFLLPRQPASADPFSDLKSAFEPSGARTDVQSFCLPRLMYACEADVELLPNPVEQIAQIMRIDLFP